MNRFFLTVIMLIFALRLPVAAADHPKYLIRCDDVGMSHAANLAAAQMAESGIPFSASVMVATPWLQEAADLLGQYPHIAVGVHLTLTSEWREMKWGPITGAAAPTLVDSNGYFFAMTQQFFQNNPSPAEVEAELRAQIDRALTSGLQVDYLDYHMGAAMASPVLRDVVEQLAKEYGLGLAQYFGETYVSVSRGEPAARTDSLIAVLQSLAPGDVTASIFHIALDTQEMQGLHDTNPNGAVGVAVSRQADLDALLSPRFAETIAAGDIRLITYKDLIRETGLENMNRPDRYNYTRQ